MNSMKLLLLPISDPYSLCIQLQAPRRHCCDVLPSSAGQVMEIAIRECKEEELIHIHA
jgi:hypothetical protein